MPACPASVGGLNAMKLPLTHCNALNRDELSRGVPVIIPTGGAVKALNDTGGKA